MVKPTEFLDDLYLKLEEIRCKHELSKENFSESIGKHRNWYQQALREKTDIGVVELMLLAKNFNVKASDLLE